MRTTKTISIVLMLSLALSALGALAAGSWEDFIDVSGHWAEEQVKRGFEDGLLTGYGDGVMGPDREITTAQMITVLTRVLGATQRADASASGIDPEAWYYEAAEKALYLGLITVPQGELDVPMLRQDAMNMLARAFSLVPAQPDFSVLDAYCDASSLKSENRGAMAALVSAGYVEGFDGSLMADSTITRAEFVTLLYRVAANYIQPYQINGSLTGGSVVKGSASLSYATLTDKLWLDCSSSSLSMFGVTGKTVILRSHALSSLSLGGGTSLETLVIDCGDGDVAPGPLHGVTLDTLRLEKAGSLSLTDSVIKNIEITGNGQSVSVSGAHEKLVISGSNNKISLGPTAQIGRVLILGAGNSLSSPEGGAELDVLELTGSGNTADISGNIRGGLSAGGSGNEITVSGDISLGISVDGSENNLALTSETSLGQVRVSGGGNWLTLTSPALEELTVSGGYNTVHRDGGGTTAALSVTGDSNKFVLYPGCVLESGAVSGASNTITINGELTGLTIDGRKTTLDGEGRAKNVTLNAGGCSILLPVENLTDNGIQDEINRVLGLVTTQYKGNYTLAWAQEHDYKDFEKEIWVNAKGYSSKTEYLIWINLSMQRVNIFKGSTGEWTLERSCIVGSGAPSTPTPVGVYATTYKLSYGWTTATYTCRPVVGFKQNSGYAFHSRLYYPNSSKLTDASIGYPVSHGCIRMYDEDIYYIYDNIPNGTTVVVY